MPLQYHFPNAGVGMTGEIDLESVREELKTEHPEFRHKRTLPAEWAPQSAIQLTWPHKDTDWADMLPEVTTTYVHLAFEIARRQPLLIVHPDTTALQTFLQSQLPEKVFQNITFFQCPTNDTWARDHAFLTIVGTEGAELMDFRFNGWGGKFEATADNAINSQLFETSHLKGRYVNALDFELEGGAIESDGMGTILTTEECLLNANRRREGDRIPLVDRMQVELFLQDSLGVERILWLKHGYLAGDDTDSHIDTLARLCPDNTIVYVQSRDENDEHHAALTAMESELRAFRTATGQPYQLIPVPMPDPIFDEEGERLPATYANFLIMNKAVLMPTYAQPVHDEAAQRALQTAFPHHEIVGIDCRSLIRQHGSLHCATMQYPRGVFIP
jgi:hypothetical protein